MLLKITIYGLCVVKESTGASDHLVVPVKRGTDTKFVLRTRKETVHPDTIDKTRKNGRGRTGFGYWTYTVPPGSILSLPSAPTAAGTIRNPVVPASLTDLGLGSLDETKLDTGSLGRLLLPSNTGGFGWVKRLGRFVLPCRDQIAAQVADVFVWKGVYGGNSIDLQIAGLGADDSPLQLLSDLDFDGLALEVGSEHLGVQNAPFKYWRSFAAVATQGINELCIPVQVDRVQQRGKRIRHATSPACPPVKD